MDTVNLMYGKGSLALKNSELLESENREQLSTILHQTVSRTIQKSTNFQIKSSLKANVKDIIQIYDRPVFNVVADSKPLNVGTSLLLLTKAGLISVNYVDFDGLVTGDEGRDWYFWGKVKDTDCFFRLNRTLLVEVNDNFIQPLQNALKANLSPELLKHKLSYIRNIIVFGSGANLLVYDREINGCTSGAEFDSKYLSKQLTTVGNLNSFLNTYIQANLKDHLMTPSHITEMTRLLKVLLVEERAFSFQLPQRVPYVTYADETKQTSSGANRSPAPSKKRKPKTSTVAGVKAFSANTPEQLEAIVNEYIKTSTAPVKDIKLSDNLLTCMLILG